MRDTHSQMWWSWQPVAHGSGKRSDTRQVFFEVTGRFVEASVLMREELSAGDRANGPAVIHQRDSTVLVPPGFVADALPSGSLVIRHSDELGETLDADVANDQSKVLAS
jgi:N-methylhydantoinase A